MRSIELHIGEIAVLDDAASQATVHHAATLTRASMAWRR
jgi:hypothetical protein